MYLTTIAGGTGDTYYDVQGRSLILIGNDRLYQGRNVWTDGHYCYSTVQMSDVPPQKPVITVGQKLPVIGNNGALFVFNSNFRTCKMYQCSRNIVAFSNTKNNYAIADDSGNIYTKKGKAFSISENNVCSLAIDDKDVYALTAKSTNLSEIYYDFNLYCNGHVVYQYDYISNLVYSQITVPSSYVIEHSGYYEIVGTVKNMGWSSDIRDRITDIQKNKGKFNNKEEDDELYYFLRSSSHEASDIGLYDKNENIIGYYNFDLKKFEIGDIESMQGKYHDSNYDEWIDAIYTDAPKALYDLGKDASQHYHFYGHEFVSYIFKKSYTKQIEQSYGKNFRPLYLYENGEVLITATASGSNTTTITTVENEPNSSDITYNFVSHEKTTINSKTENKYQLVISNTGAIKSFTADNGGGYKLDGKLLASNGTGFIGNKQITETINYEKDSANLCGIQVQDNTLSFWGGACNNIYINNTIADVVSGKMYMNNRLHLMDDNTLDSLIDFLGAKQIK